MEAKEGEKGKDGMKTILVTGGAGFVGSHLAIGARARYGARVVAFDNLKRRGSELGIGRLKAAGVDFVHGDIRCLDDLEAVGPVDLILECSAEPSVLAGYGDSPRYVVQTNLTGTINALEVARRHGAGMIFLSTSRVYPMAAIAALAYREADTRFELMDGQAAPGVSPQGISESFPLEGVRSLYGATKLCSELLLREYLAMYGLRGVINRCGVIAGPWQMGKVDQGVAVLWVARHLFGGALKYIGYGGQGKQVRDLLHIADLEALLYHQIDHLDRLNGQTFNVGGGPECSVSLLELTELCRQATGKTIPIESEAETRAADIPWYVTDNARVTAATGWRPQRRAQAIVEDIAAWIAAHEEALRSILA